MCIIIYKPAKTPTDALATETLHRCYKNNPDGVGYAYTTGEKLIIHKFLGFDEFQKLFLKDLFFYPKAPFLLHFRYATHGAVSLENTHPFRIGKDAVFAHNGIISSLADKKDISDSRRFGDEVLRELPAFWTKKEGLIKVLEGFLAGNKVVYLQKNGNATILNERLGVWDKGLWYSNTGYKPTPLLAWDNELWETEECEICGAQARTYKIKTDLNESYYACRECRSLFEDTKQTNTAKTKQSEGGRTWKNWYTL